MPAKDDTFRFSEVDRYQFGMDLFADNGSGADAPSGGITHVNGQPLTDDTLDFVYLSTPAGASIYVGTVTGSTFPQIVPGGCDFFFGDTYDYLPAGVSTTVSFTYTINDGVESSTATVRFIITGIDSDDIIHGSAIGETKRGGLGDDKMYGYGGLDYLYAGEGDDTLDGGTGNDRLYGEAGFDELKGGSGIDFLYGGLKSDSLIGGSDHDFFVFRFVSESSAGKFDVIQDFNRAQGDDIDLRDIDANSKIVGNQAFKFIGAAAFHKIAGEMRYQNAGNAVFAQGDTNGDGRADFEVLLNKIKTLNASDFLL